MARRGNGPELRVRTAFEAARIAPQCLVDAYEHLVPIPRRPTRPRAPDAIIDAGEFKPRLSGLKQRLARLQAERDAANAAHEAERGLQLVIGRLDEFAARIRAGLHQLDWHGRREIIRALVRRIEIDHQ